MTWKELKTIVLQKMFELQGADLVVDDSTAPYINAMPGAVNEALNLLCTQACYFKKTGEIIQGGDRPTAPTFSAGPYNGYDLSKVFDDYYTMYDGYIKFTDGESYGTATNYDTEGASTLLIPKDITGTWRVTYCAYPMKITKDTPDDTDLGLPPEVVNKVAVYMAGQLYKEDDISIAQIYMNEFLTWLSMLKESAAKADSMGNAGSWESTTGWW